MIDKEIPMEMKQKTKSIPVTVFRCQRCRQVIGPMYNPEHNCLMGVGYYCPWCGQKLKEVEE